MKKYFFLTALIGTLIFSVSIFACIPAFAYESTDVDYDIFWQNSLYPNSSSTRYIIYDSSSPLTSDYVTVADSYMFGYQLSTAVPYYADGDHVSLFGSFGVAIPRVNFQGTDNRWEGQYYFGLGPWNTRSGIIYSEGNMGTNLFSLADFVYNNYTVQQKTGTFSWQGLQQCSFKALIYHGGSSSAQGVTDYEYFFINLQLDLNITQGYELMPLSLYCYQSRSATGAYHSYKVDVRPTFRMNDTSMYGLLEEIKASIDSIDFSALADLSQLSTSIQNIYNQVVLQNDLIEGLVDDTSPDPDITRFNEEAAALKSEAAELHSIENQLYGTISDFTFPEVSDTSVVSSMFTEWLQDNLILTLLVVSLAFMLVFSFI